MKARNTAIVDLVTDIACYLAAAAAFFVALMCLTRVLP